MESTGFPPLDSLAVDAMTAAEFIPARVGADPVSLWVGMPVTFQ